MKIRSILATLISAICLALLLLATARGAEPLLSAEMVYVTNFDDNFISVIDAKTHRKVADIRTGSKPHGVTVTPDGRKVYVSNEGDNNVSVIDPSSLKVLRSIPVGLDPNWIDFTADGRYAYVSNTASNDVSVVDTAAGKVIATIPVGKSPKRLTVGRIVAGRQ